MFGVMMCWICYKTLWEGRHCHGIDDGCLVHKELMLHIFSFSSFCTIPMSFVFWCLERSCRWLWWQNPHDHTSCGLVATKSKLFWGGGYKLNLVILTSIQIQLPRMWWWLNRLTDVNEVGTSCCLVNDVASSSEGKWKDQCKDISKTKTPVLCESDTLCIWFLFCPQWCSHAICIWVLGKYTNCNRPAYVSTSQYMSHQTLLGL